MLLALEGAARPGPNAPQDHLTLLLGANTAGEFRLKPLLVYPSENPRALKGCSEASLPVVWRDTQHLPGLVRRLLLPCGGELLRQPPPPAPGPAAPGRRPLPPSHLGSLSAHVHVEFLPKNTALIHPMNQGVIAAFKARYLRRTLGQLVREKAGVGRPSTREFWRSYTVMTAVDNIAQAWAELQPATMNRAWRKLWPECVSPGAVEPDAEPRSAVASGR
ncbi:tigger transposable element-derived protein 1-like [Myotis lucifugus]|uniref:tigger transposable element-derived protein 1-like n=1 Tax=Myotis lucifugus TaxID=59463 RepID=UPI000CCC69A7|nr:tigger transposable element-derived protein 1-like [Myotis lucifugus]XP_023604819.1 tigger transposable element-derived protein 1-like [Myotis lucifugus]